MAWQETESWRGQHTTRSPKRRGRGTAETQRVGWPTGRRGRLGFPVLAVGYWYRMTGVDDLLLNVAGVLLGFGVYAAIRGRRKDHPHGGRG